MTRFIEFTGGDVEAYLHAQEQKDLLRFITCGSVDDGKSTLIIWPSRQTMGRSAAKYSGTISMFSR